MPTTMKALKDFRGKPGEGKDRMVEAGMEFKVENQSRANDLESRGFAAPVVAAAKLVHLKNKKLPQPENKAADAGPLASRGGRTGAATPQSSSPPAPAPRTRRSRKPAGGLDL